jgi:hypothetical protein
MRPENSKGDRNCQFRIALQCRARIGLEFRVYAGIMCRTDRVNAELQTFSHSRIHLTVAHGDYFGEAICG